ncbi:MAG: phosphoribosylanthranilate isomerase [Methanocorpusculum parvum]|nr:phosphoribosylanthranilate isomerase [Methanocorpusculum parvum]
MKCKICGTGTRDDLEIAVTAGADAVGFIVGTTHTSEDSLSPAEARAMIRSLPPFVSGVVVTHLTDADDLVRIVEETGCSVLQIQDSVPVETLVLLREQFSYLFLIKAVHVLDESAVDTAKSFEPYADAVLLDSRTADRIGGTGITHDWSISAKVVEAVSKPVILAGGLRPENLAAAMSVVKPYAVDVHSGVKRDGVRDFDRTRDFVRIAHGF